MKKTLRSAMLSTIAMLVVAVLSLTGVTYAWFTQGTTATVDGMTMEVSSAGAGLQVSLDNSTWSDSISFTSTAKENLIPVSTVNGEDFYKATATVGTTKITTHAVTEDDSATWSETFYMQNTGTDSIDVKLDGTVFSKLESDTTNKVTYKAARVAIFADGELAYIHGDDNVLGVNGEGEFNSDASAGSETVKLGSVDGFQSNVANCILSIPGADASSGEPQPVEITVVIWIEGQDLECISDNAASAFNVALNFAVVEA